jgi:hypothetical protein
MSRHNTLLTTIKNKKPAALRLSSFFWLSRLIQEKIIKEFVCLSIYLFCPGGALPAGFTFVVVVYCVSPEPVHDGCCPPG